MLRYGRIAVVIGIILTVIGLLVGFIALARDADEFAKLFIALVPVGFVTLFAGLAATLLAAPEKNE